MRTKNPKRPRPKRINLTTRGSMLILLAAFSISTPVAICHLIITGARQNEYLSTTEAFLATALSVHLENMTDTSQQYADWVTRLSGQSEQLRWAAIIKPNGETVEFRRRTAFPIERITQQIKFDLSEPRIRPLLIGGLPSERLRIICIPQDDSDAVVAAIVDTGAGSALPRSLFVWTVGLVVGGLGASFAWLHYAMIMPLRRSTAALTDIQAGVADLSLEQLPVEEFRELASSIRQTKHQLQHWKQRAEHLSETVDRRVENLTRDATRAQSRAEKEAHTDSLSGLASRRTLEKELPKLVASHLLSDCELTLAMIDVNHFKTYNDTRGHTAGDELITFIGGLLRNSTRKNVDLAARFGGDEFVVVLPNTGVDNAVVTLKRMAAMFAQYIKTRPSLLTPPSLAVGIAAVHDHGLRSADRLIEAADAAMYHAKRTGVAVVAAHETLDAPFGPIRPLFRNT